MNRIEKSVKNSIMGITGQLLSTVLGFAVRSVFIFVLGKTYLGLNGLFSNILSILNIAEMGTGAAIIFQMYKTVAEKDEEKTKQYLAYLQKVYRIIGVVIFASGLCLLPFLSFLISSNIPNINIYFVFLLFLTNSASSYWMFAYRGAVVVANQESYKLRFISYIQTVLLSILQIVFLLIFHEIYIYLILPIVIGLIFSLIKGVMIGKFYPYIREKPIASLSELEVSALKKNISALVIYKICSAVLSSITTLLISVFVGLAVIGLYSNYLLIISTVSAIFSKLFTGLSSGIGNAHVTETKERKLQIFQMLNFAYFWVYGFAAICFYVLFSPFINLWLDESFLLSSFTEFVIVLNFIIFAFMLITAHFRLACGLFYKSRFRPIFSVIVNIIASYLLIIFFKPFVPSLCGGVVINITVIHYDYVIAGALLGVIISRVFVTWWYDGWLVFTNIFERKPFRYYLEYWFRIAFVLVLGYALKIICQQVDFKNELLNFIAMLAICVVVINSLYFLCFFKTKEFKDIKEIVFTKILKKV